MRANTNPPWDIPPPPDKVCWKCLVRKMIRIEWFGAREDYTPAEYRIFEKMGADIEKEMEEEIDHEDPHD